ncbi:PilT domain-containing protein [Thiomonas sp. X19]|uniref:putative toxin-antitoxin system toxin component, PIN family n=1 Tax=Thiomonas sp. X19 TaxID=1050370 RepID=UPI000B6A4CA0|nr:putative toxin-antitoxin system toxin component, PIN family [Thiomonas sp. X19]SCC93021.1 PilT domain-containing protein [Thiomonas sp. X19]
MRVVLDSNVLLSALIAPHGAPHALYCAWRERRFEIITAQKQIEEIRRASRYPKFKAILQPHLVGAMLNNLQGAQIIDPMPATQSAADPDDAFLLDLALAGDADFLVTGDHRAGLLQRSRIGRARILTPADMNSPAAKRMAL